MKIKIDKEAGAAYIDLTSEGIKPKQVAHTRYVRSNDNDNVRLDFDRDGRLLGVEILDLRLLPP